MAGTDQNIIEDIENFNRQLPDLRYTATASKRLSEPTILRPQTIKKNPSVANRAEGSNDSTTGASKNKVFSEPAPVLLNLAHGHNQGLVQSKRNPLGNPPTSKLKPVRVLHSGSPNNMHSGSPDHTRPAQPRGTLGHECKHKISHQVPCLLFQNDASTQVIIYHHGNGEDLFDSCSLCSALHKYLNVNLLYHSKKN